VKPDHIMVYVLVGYWPGETAEDRDYRRRKLREFGARPYPMPYTRTSELIAFQRWVLGAYDKSIAWRAWMGARGQPRNLGTRAQRLLPIMESARILNPEDHYIARQRADAPLLAEGVENECEGMCGV
jgi:hypothetical protein